MRYTLMNVNLKVLLNFTKQTYIHLDIDAHCFNLYAIFINFNKKKLKHMLQ